MFVTPKFCISIAFSFFWEFKWPLEKLKTMLMQNFGVTNKEHYGMLWCFLEGAIQRFPHRSPYNLNKENCLYEFFVKCMLNVTEIN